MVLSSYKIACNRQLYKTFKDQKQDLIFTCLQTNKMNKLSNPKIDISYQSGRYTASIEFEDKSIIITDGNSVDDLMKNIDDAVWCHFGHNKNWEHTSIDMKISLFNIDYSYRNTFA